jgi:hypothetical protein
MYTKYEWLNLGDQWPLRYVREFGNSGYLFPVDGLITATYKRWASKVAALDLNTCR